MASTRRLLSLTKGEIVKELDVTRILPQLLHRKVFTAADQREILSSSDARFRADVFVERLASKGPDAFQEFCVALERCDPRLLTHLVVLLGRLHENPENSSVSSKTASHVSTICDATLNERQGPERMTHLLQEDLDVARRQYDEMKKERDEAFAMLENIRNQQRPVVKDAVISGHYGNASEYVPQSPSSFSEHGKEWIEEGGEKVIWENHPVVLNRVPNCGFGIAVTGGKDNPQFANGDPAIVVSDVLKNGPADGKLYIGDRIVSVNNIPLDNVDHSMAISLLKDSGAMANLLVCRRFILTSNTDFDQPFKVTLTKKNKKDDYGIVLGYKLYVKEIVPNSLAAQESYLKEGDTIMKLNNSQGESLSLSEARKQMEKSKDKLQLVIAKTSYKRTVENILPSSVKQSSLRPPRQPAGDATMSSVGGPVGFDKIGSKPMNSTDPNFSLGPHYPVSDRQFPYGESEPMHSNQTIPTEPLARPLSGAMVSPLSPHNVPGCGDYPVVPASTAYLPSIVAGPVNGYRPVHDYPGSPLRNYEYGRQLSHLPDDADLYRRSVHELPEPRLVSFKKDGGVGIRVSGGNRTGIFIARVAPNTPAERQGLTEGDLILRVNDIDMRGKTREEAVLFLLSLHDHVALLVQRRQLEYERLMAEGGTGDLFYIRTHFNYEVTEHGELSFKRGDVFQITDTLYSGVVGSWQAIRVARTSQEAKKGIIPNLNRAEQFALSQSAADKESPSASAKSSNRGSSFFKKKSSWRAKSLGHDHWDEAMFVGGKGPSDARHRKSGARVTKYPAYERVVLRDVGFVRPVVLLGPLADVAREKLVRELPDWFELPQSDVIREGDKIVKAGIIRLTAIRETIDKRKHAVLDVTPNAIDRLNYAQYAPVVAYLKAESKHAVKELRQHWAKNSNKSPRKLYDYGLRLEKSWSHLFTNTVALTNGEMWYKKLKEVIEKAQIEKVWMSETKPESLKDDILFPMTRRLSFISSPESDMDATVHGPCSEDEAEFMRSPYNFGRPVTTGTRLMRSSSDPSIGAADNIPGSSSLYPSGAPVYGQDVYQPTQYRTAGPRTNLGTAFGPPVRRDWTSSGGFADSRYLAPRPDGSPMHQGQLGYSPKKSYLPYGNRYQTDHYYRSNIDPYATLTPSERMRYQPAVDVDRRYRDPFYVGRYLRDSPGMNPQQPLSSLGTGPSPQGAVDLQKLSLPPVGDANGYLYWTEPVQDDRREKLSSQPGGYERHLAKDDHPYRYSLSLAKPYSQFPDRMAPESTSYRSSDQLNKGRTNVENRKPPQGYPFDREYSDNWRAKSDTNLSRDPVLSYASKIPYLEIDRNPDGEVTQKENLENRNHYPYDVSPTANMGNTSQRDSVPEYYSEGLSNLPPAKPPHLSYPKYNGLSTAPHRTNASQELLSKDGFPSAVHGLESFRAPETQLRVLGSKEEQPYSTHGLNIFEAKPSSDKKQDHPNSAFESYRKPETASSANSHQRDSSLAEQENNHTIVATARGVFDSNGGTLESKETGVAIVIPKGAIPEGVKQEIYFKVCRDNNILPPLDKDKGETLLSPLVMCGPHGLKFLQPVELHLPHSASVNPESWSFALKSSDSPTGHPTHWQNIALAGTDGISQGKVNKNSVTVLVDHF